MVTFLILFIIAIAVLVIGVITDKYWMGFLFVLFGVCAFIVPFWIGEEQTNLTEIVLEEYQVCEYKSESIYLYDNTPYNVDDIRYIRISPDDEVHVKKIKTTAPKSIWYFYSLGEQIIAYIPIECK